MSYSWESVVVDWVDEWKVWSVCGLDAQGNSEYLSDAALKKHAINDALEYAFRSGNKPLGRRVDVYSKQGARVQCYSMEEAEAEKRQKEYEQVYVVTVETVRRDSYVVVAASEADLKDKFKNDRKRWVPESSEPEEASIVSSQKTYRLKRGF